MTVTGLRRAAARASERGDLPKAVELTKEALLHQPGDASLYYNLGLLHTGLGDHRAALRAARKAVRLDGSDTDTLLLLATLLQGQNDFRGAARFYGQAAGIDGGADLHAARAGCLIQAGMVEEALGALRRALEIDPASAEAKFLLAKQLFERGQSTEAESLLRDVLRRDPAHLNGWATLANVYQKRGDLRRNIQAIRRLVAAGAGLAEQHGALLWSMLHSGDVTAEAVFGEQKRWARLHAAGIEPDRDHANVPDPERRLRIAYISDQFRESAISFCDEIILAAHDRSQVEIFLYSDTARPDGFTERRKQLAEGWREIVGMSHEAVAELIRKDRIDILLNQCDYHWMRMLVFARKPAPVQMALPYYPASTGLPAMDYFVTDTRTNPAEAREDLFTEQLLRVPHLLTYQPREYTPEVSELPARRNGYVTFACFHRLVKLNREVVALWGRILRETPGSRLLMHHTFGNPIDDAIPEQVRRWFEPEGIGMDRIELVGSLSQPDHYKLYHRVDIALDAFPYTGHTTTCTAIWMGVPVVALRGKTHVARVSASLLESAGLEEFVADTAEDYVGIALGLAGDKRRLARLRAGLRKRMARSPLVDGRAVAAGLEAGFRWAWRRWCEGRARA